MYYYGQPIYTIPKYISRKMKSSFIILYKDSEEDFMLYLSTYFEIEMEGGFC